MTREELRGAIVARIDGRSPPADYSERTVDAILALAGKAAVEVADEIHRKALDEMESALATLELPGLTDEARMGARSWYQSASAIGRFITDKSAALRELFGVKEP